MRRRMSGLARVTMCALVVLCAPAQARAEELPHLKATAPVIDRLYPWTSLTGCVFEKLRAQFTGDAQVRQWLVDKQLARDTYAKIEREIDDPQHWLADFVPMSTDPDGIAAEQVLHTLHALHTTDEDVGLNRMWVDEAFLEIANRGLDQPCVPYNPDAKEPAND